MRVVPTSELEHAVRSAIDDPIAAMHSAVRCMNTPVWPEIGSLMLSLQWCAWLVECLISTQHQ